MTREVTDNLYIELGYYDPEEYYVYQAEALSLIADYIDIGYIDVDYYQGQGSGATLVCDLTEVIGETVEASGSWTSEFSTVCSAGVIRESGASLVSEFTQTATISHLEGADLFAFAEAAIAIQVDRIRDSNISVSGQFDIATDAIRLVNISADQSSEFAIDLTVERSREATMAVEAAFFIDTAVEIISANIEAEAALSSEFVVDAQVGRLTLVDAALESEITLSVAIEAIRETEVQLESTATLELPFIVRTVEFTAALTDAFTPTVQVEAIRNSFAVLDAVSTVTAEVDRITGTVSADLAVSTDSDIQADRFAEVQLAVTATVSLAVQADSAKGTAVTLTAQSALSTNPNYILLFRPQLKFTYTSALATVSAEQVRFGTNSLRTNTLFTTANVPLSAVVSPGIGENVYEFDSKDWTIEFWYYDRVNIPDGLGSASIFTLRNSSNQEALSLTKQYNATNNVNRYRLDGDFTGITSTYTINTWRHVAVVYVSSTREITVYVDGSRMGGVTRTVGAGFSNIRRFNLAAPASLGGAYYDELRISPSVRYSGTSFTVPSQQFNKNRTDIALFRFESQSGPDLAGSFITVSEQTLETGAAALTAQTTVTATLSGVQKAAAQLSSQGFVVAAVVRKVDELADLVTTASLTVNAGKLIALSSAVNSTTAVTASATRIKRFNAAITGAFNASTTVKIFEGFALLTLPSVATVTAKARYANGGLRSTITATAQITATGREIVKDPAPVFVPNPNSILIHFDGTEPSGTDNFYIFRNEYNPSNSIVGTIEQPGKFGDALFDCTVFPNYISGGPQGGLQDFTAEAWFKPEFGLTSKIFSLETSNNTRRYEVMGRYQFVDGAGKFQVSYTISQQAFTTVGNFDANKYYHIVLQRQGFTKTVWVDGQLIITTTDDNYVLTGRALVNTDYDNTVPITNLRGDPGYLDEFRVVPYAAYTTTFTPPTAPYEAEGDFIWTRLGDALLEPRFSLGILITQNAQANLSAAFAQATAATRTRRTSSTQSSQFAQTATVTRTRNAQALVSAAATVTASVDRFRTGSSTQSVTSTLAAEVSRTRDLDASIQSQTVITAAASRTRTAVLDISSSSDLSVAVERIRSFDTEFASIATQLAAVGYNATGTVLLESEFTTTAQAEKTTDITLDLLTVVDLTADSDRIRDLSSDIVSDFTIDIDADKILPFGAVIQAEFAQTANTDQAVIRGFSSDLSSSTEFSIVDTLFNGYSADLTAETELSITATRLKLAQSQLNAESEFTITAGNLRSVSVSMTAFAFQLAAGQVLKLDPALQIRVPQETRHSQILKESRVIMVEQETRVNMIL